MKSKADQALEKSIQDSKSIMLASDKFEIMSDSHINKTVGAKEMHNQEEHDTSVKTDDGTKNSFVVVGTSQQEEEKIDCSETKEKSVKSQPTSGDK